MIVFQILATLALLAAALLSLMLGAATQFFTARPPTGADAMGLAGVFFGMALRSVLMLTGALVCVGLGRFDWVSARPGVPTMAVIAGMIGLAVVIGAGWMQWSGPAKPWTVAAGNLGGILLPLLIQGYLLSLVWSERTPGWARAPALALGGIAVIGLILGAVMLVGWQIAQMRAEQRQYEHDRQWQEDNRRENREREARQLAELEALGEQEPLRVFLTHLFIDKSEAHHARAMERIAALPNLDARIDELMNDPDPLQREYCANYIRLAANPAPAWGPIVKRAMGRLAGDIAAAPLLYDPPTQRTYRGMMMGIFMTARRFPELDFRAEAEAIRAAVAAHPDEVNRGRCLDLADRFLSGAALEDE